MSNAKGFIPVMLTPFSSDGNIDFKVLTQLIEMYLKAATSLASGSGKLSLMPKYTWSYSFAIISACIVVQ